MMAKQAGVGIAVAMALTAGSGQQAMAQAELSETDRYALESAESACANQEFSALVQAMAISDLVRAKYSAPNINVVLGNSATTVSSQDYADFPIGMLDYYWISGASMRAWEADAAAEIDYLEMELNQSQSNYWAVDWQIVRYDGNSEGGDDLGEVIERVGKPGVLGFEPYNGCWRLFEDARGQ